MSSCAPNPDLEWNPTSGIGCVPRQQASSRAVGGSLRAQTSTWGSGRVDSSFHACGWICTCWKARLHCGTWGRRRNRINSLGPGLAARPPLPRSDKNLSRLCPRLGRLTGLCLSHCSIENFGCPLPASGQLCVSSTIQQFCLPLGSGG